ALNELPSMEPGTIRPVFPGSVQSISADAVSRALVPGGRTTPELAGRRRTELQTLLLYAHAVAVPNPLQPEVRLCVGGDGAGQRLILDRTDCSDEQFLLGIYSICDLDRLSRDSIIQYFESPSVEPNSSRYDLDDVAAGIGRALYTSYAINDFDQEVMKRAGT